MTIQRNKGTYLAYLSVQLATNTLPPPVIASWAAKISSRLLRIAVLGLSGISVLIYVGHSRVTCQKKCRPLKWFPGTKRPQKFTEDMACLHSYSVWTLIFAVLAIL